MEGESKAFSSEQARCGECGAIKLEMGARYILTGEDRITGMIHLEAKGDEEVVTVTRFDKESVVVEQDVIDVDEDSQFATVNMEFR